MTSSALPWYLPRLCHKYVGNSALVTNPTVKDFFASKPPIAWMNDVYFLAPTMKTCLSILPFYNIVLGSDPAKVDLKINCAMSFTGFVWAYYATLIRPQNSGTRLLAAVNFAMGSSYAVQISRKVQWMGKEGIPFNYATLVEGKITQ